MTDASKPGNAANVPNAPEAGVSRRDFLNEITFAALGIAAGGSAIVTYGYLEPNVLFEPPTKFRAGAPDLYPVNTVTYLPSSRCTSSAHPRGFMRFRPYALTWVVSRSGSLRRNR